MIDLLKKLQSSQRTQRQRDNFYLKINDLSCCNIVFSERCAFCFYRFFETLKRHFKALSLYLKLVTIRENSWLKKPVKTFAALRLGGLKTRPRVKHGVASVGEVTKVESGLRVGGGVTNKVVFSERCALCFYPFLRL